MNSKDQKIIKDSEKRGIPIFVLTAKDLASIITIREYLKKCIDLECSKDHLFGIVTRIEEFKEWQQSNEDKMKIPD